jgi:hypothetical protein
MPTNQLADKVHDNIDGKIQTFLFQLLYEISIFIPIIPHAFTCIQKKQSTNYRNVPI